MRRSKAQEVRSESMSHRARYGFTAFSLLHVVAGTLLAGVCVGLVLAGGSPLLFGAIVVAMLLATGGVVWHARERTTREGRPNEEA